MDYKGTFLDVLNEFCIDWKLDVKHEKSKVVVSNSKGKSHVNTFKYKDYILEAVKSYCYLGVTIKYSGHIDGSSKLLIETDRKSFF